MRNKIKRPDGYIDVYRPDIANTKSGYMPESRAIWIDRHGDIPDGAVVHHVNQVKDDNRLENLRLFPDNGEHRRQCHGDLSWLADVQRMKPFDLFDWAFLYLHLPLDRVK